MLDELVIQIGHATLHRGGHAHLILLHQELDHVSLEISLAHAVQRSPGGLPVVAKPFGVGVSDGEELRAGQKLLLQALREHGEVLVEERSRAVR